jgi:UDP-N-acetylmuramyl tripeptide synthase
MKIRFSAAVAAAKVTTFILRILGSGGTSFPGKAAMFFKRDLLQVLAENIKVIIITGTNGKTTTSRITSRILEASGLSYFENKSGANLISGITASFSLNCYLDGKPKHEYAVIECDEAAFRTVCPMIQPAAVIVTNLFRDQLDRYGEITHTRNNIIEGLKSSPSSCIILNADDSLSYSIADEVKNSTVLYGINSPPYGEDSNFISDAPYCIRCKSQYEYDYRVYAHLGGFRCTGCGYSRVVPEIYAEDIQLNPDSSKITLGMPNDSTEATIALPGAYNIYNALAASAAAYVLGIETGVIASALSSFKSGFGRMEHLELDGIDLHMILVKNPAGLNQVINFLSTSRTLKKLVMILNDNFADGTDISWIWDANFEKIISFSDFIEEIYVTGTRAEELALRLKYAGFSSKSINVEKNYNAVIDAVITGNAKKTPVFILPTYTAMFDFRKALSGKYKIKEFWK